MARPPLPEKQTFSGCSKKKITNSGCFGRDGLIKTYAIFESKTFGTRIKLVPLSSGPNSDCSFSREKALMH